MNELQEIFAVRLPSIDYLLQADRDLQQLLVAERSMSFANAKSDTFKDLVTEYEDNFRQSQERWEKYKALPVSPEEAAIIPLYDKARDEWKTISRQVVDGRIADTREGRSIALDLSLGKAKAKFEEMREHLNQLTEINQTLATQAKKSAVDSYQHAFRRRRHGTSLHQRQYGVRRHRGDDLNRQRNRRAVRKRPFNCQ